MGKGTESKDAISDPPSTVTDVDHERHTIEGELYKKSALTWKPRYFVFGDGRLQYFASRGDGKVRGELEFTHRSTIIEFDKRPFSFQVRECSRSYAPGRGSRGMAARAFSARVTCRREALGPTIC